MPLKKRIKDVEKRLPLKFSEKHHFYKEKLFLPVEFSIIGSWNRLIKGKRYSKPIIGKKAVYIEDSEYHSVESLVLKGFIQDGWKGHYCETSIFTTLFGLIMYDLLFMDWPFVFQSSFQGNSIKLK